jgi:hypothetical protein
LIVPNDSKKGTRMNETKHSPTPANVQHRGYWGYSEVTIGQPLRGDGPNGCGGGCGGGDGGGVPPPGCGGDGAGGDGGGAGGGAGDGIRP